MLFFLMLALQALVLLFVLPSCGLRFDQAASQIPFGRTFQIALFMETPRSVWFMPRS